MSADSVLAPIWYRHWLELRRPMCIALVVAAGMILLYPIAVHGYSTHLAETGNLARQIRDIGPAVDRVSLTLVVPWAVHVQFLTFLTVVVPVFFSGSCLNTPSQAGMLAPRHASVLFTLSLPLSRQTLVLTRLAAGLAVLSALVVLLLVLHSITLIVLGRPPAVVMLQALMMAGAATRALVAMSVALAFLGVVTVVLNDFWGATVGVCAMFVALAWWWTSIEHFIAGATLRQVGIALACTAALVAASVVLAREKEH